VLVINVDDIDPEPSEARVACLRDIGRPSVDVMVAVPLDEAGFGGEHDLVAPALQRLAEQRFVMAPAIKVRGIQMVDAELDRLVQEHDRGRFVDIVVAPDSE
jgi:hypothetical protein